MARCGRRLLRRKPAANQLFQAIDDLVLVQAVGEHLDGVFRLQQGADRAGGVFHVAPLLGGKDLRQRCRFSPLPQVMQPPAGPLLRAGRKEDLALGVGEDDRPLIAAFGYDVAPAAAARCNNTRWART